MIKVSDYIIDYLYKKGVEDIFMFVGGGAMHLNDSVGKHNKINNVTCLHEQACAIAAESYARCKNNLGVAIVTTGPGATNTVTGIAGAWIESTPLFVISGQVKRSDSMLNTGVRQMGVQEVDIVSIVKPITKYAVLLNDPQKVRYELEKCIYLATNGRKGPVLLDIPLDVQATMIDETNLEPYLIVNEQQKIDKSSMGELLSLITNCKKPLLYVGAGVYFANAQKEFLECVNRFNIPVVTTWNGMDLIWDDHPLYMGRPGAIGQRAANFMIQNCDLLIAVGTRLASLQTGFNYASYAKKAKLVMVDIDINELNKEKLHPYIKVHSDAKYFFATLLSSDIKLNDYSEWVNRCNDWKKKYPNLNPNWLNDKFVNSYYLVDAISTLMDSEDVYCGGRAGTCIDTIIQAFKVKENQRVIATKGLSSMGYGIPAAIGASFAFKGKKIICNNGDGGFVMNIQELAVIKRHNLPIKFFILNNNGYATIVSTQTNVFNKHFVGCTPESGLSVGDIKAIAIAYGIKVIEIKSNNEIWVKVQEALLYDGPIVCDVKVSIMQPIEPRQANYKTPEGQMASRPLEDMKPLLSREELAENMM